MKNSFIFNARVYKMQVFEKLYLNPKVGFWFLRILNFLIFLSNPNERYSLIYILKLMESKIKEDIKEYNVNEYVQYLGLGKGLQKEEIKFLKLVIDYLGTVIDYKPLYTPTC